mmetsp:Transcript_27793/g.64095  ORF Transcript_27793/g.64095 Transcript_27793/m.64095 type:complete len:283 (+) Transcript_27793:1265-2113(+)
MLASQGLIIGEFLLLLFLTGMTHQSVYSGTLLWGLERAQHVGVLGRDLGQISLRQTSGRFIHLGQEKTAAVLRFALDLLLRCVLGLGISIWSGPLALTARQNLTTQLGKQYLLKLTQVAVCSLDDVRREITLSVSVLEEAPDESNSCVLEAITRGRRCTTSSSLRREGSSRWNRRRVGAQRWGRLGLWGRRSMGRGRRGRRARWGMRHNRRESPLGPSVRSLQRMTLGYLDISTTKCIHSLFCVAFGPFREYFRGRLGSKEFRLREVGVIHKEVVGTTVHRQ